MFKKGYEIFVRNLEELEQDKEVEKQIRDAETYESKNVRAIFSSSPKKLPGRQDVWIRALVGHLLDEKPWKIKIIKELK